MQETFYKIFFSKVNEKAWLNHMGSMGYKLLKIKDSKYYFEVSDEHKYFYSIENIGCSPKSNVALEYIDKYSSQNVNFALSKGNWMYFLSEDYDFAISSSVYKKNNDVYFWRLIYLGFFAIAFAVVLGYQLFATDFLSKIGHISDGKVAAIPVESIFDSLQNSFFKLLNNSYFVPFRMIFGYNDASVVIALVLPVVIICSILFSLNLDEYLNNRNLIRQKSNDEKEEANAQ